MDKRPTERFTNRVENYVRYRPDYPDALVPLFQREIGLQPDWVIGDIGSGPGNLAKQFLRFGASVYGVEPNRAMREAGESLMAGEPLFTSVPGSAEATTLPDASIDLVTAAQAFHWFDPGSARAEFQRILRAPKWVALVWNRRTVETSAFLDEYEDMLRQYSRDYDRVSVRDDTASGGMGMLFGSNGYRLFTLANRQLLDADAYWGRLLSSSYTPLPGELGHDKIRRRSAEIFDTYAEDGILHFPYETRVYIGRVHEDGC